MKRADNVAAVTSKDVAKLANVSQPTVSRVFSNPDLVKPETAQKVRFASKLLGYTPNALARGLNNNKTDLVAVVTVNSSNPFYQMELMLISEMIGRLDKQMLLLQSEFEQDLTDILERVLQYQVDAVVLISAVISSDIKERFDRIGIPLVIFNKCFESQSFYSVCSDNVDGGRMVANYLVEKGYTSFGYISGELLKQTSQNRYRGFLQGLGENGYTCSALEDGDYTYRSGYDALLRMSKKGQLPAAVFCASDLMAFGAMDAARQELGLSIPQDIAFVGFDDLSMSEWKGYDLTTVAQPLRRMAEYAQNYLWRRFNGEEASGGCTLLKCSIVKRSSA